MRERKKYRNPGNKVTSDRYISADFSLENLAGGSSPIFSVVVTVYNQREYVGRAVGSVLSQTFPDFELIVVDDGSSDDGVDTISDISDDRLVVLRQDNQGVGRARNTGIERASGAWVAFLDGDDIWCENHLEELRRVTLIFPASVVISTSFQEVDNVDVPLLNSMGGGVIGSHIKAVDYLDAAFDGHHSIWTSCLAVRRDVFNEVGGFGDYSRGEDIEMWVRIALNYCSHLFAVSDRVTSFYVRGTGGITEHAEQSRRTTPPAACLSEVSPALATVERFIGERQRSVELGRRVRKFINAHLRLGIKIDLLKSDSLRARSLARLFVKPKSLFDRVHTLATWFPSKTWPFIYQLRSRLRARRASGE